ncbi:hypothetical protein [Serratia bockelmannii]|uniref:hypothetical protein n=1 Tax=Serratia bockelmannii TaxID=2703793 RepID=UPI003FA6F64D
MNRLEHQIKKIAQNKINYQPVVSEQDDITAKNPILRLICNKRPTEQALTPLAGKKHGGRSDKGCLLGTATWCVKKVGGTPLCGSR